MIYLEKGRYNATCNTCGQLFRESDPDKKTLKKKMVESGWKVDGDLCDCQKCWERETAAGIKPWKVKRVL